MRLCQDCTNSDPTAEVEPYIHSVFSAGLSRSEQLLSGQRHLSYCNNTVFRSTASSPVIKSFLCILRYLQSKHVEEQHVSRLQH
jgi:hypothetical protein